MGTDNGKAQVRFFAGLLRTPLQRKQAGGPISIASAGGKAGPTIENQVFPVNFSVYAGACSSGKTDPFTLGDNLAQDATPSRAELTTDEMEHAQVVPQAPGG